MKHSQQEKTILSHRQKSKISLTDEQNYIHDKNLYVENMGNMFDILFSKELLVQEIAPNEVKLKLGQQFQIL